MNEDKRLNEVIRVQKRPNNFVMMDRAFLENEHLSWKAKGILAYLLSKPDNWKVIAGDLIHHATDGKGSVYKGLAELKAEGYYRKTPVRNEKGIIIRWDSVVFEIPNAELMENSGVCPLPKNQEMDNQDMDKPFMENREHNKNNSNNNYMTKNPVKSSQNGQTELQEYLTIIQKNICYEDLKLTHTADMKLIDECISILLDTLLSQSKTVHISGEDKPRQLVISNLLKLEYHDIVHVIEQYKSQSTKITKKRQYILTMLYNSKLELESHYTNLVQSYRKGK